LLLVPPAGPVSGEAAIEFTLYLNNSTDRPETVYLPVELVASYATPSTGTRRATLALVNPSDVRRNVPPMSRQTIVLRLTKAIPGGGGFVSLRLDEPLTNAVMFELAPVVTAPATSPAPANVTGPAEQVPSFRQGRSLDLSTDIESMRRHISSYDPIYFAVGWRQRFNARFQFSFKYRLFESGPPTQSRLEQLAREFYVAYTQTSIWDLESFSKPFYDSSYKPTAFVLHEMRFAPGSPLRLNVQAGAQHESNGKGGSAASLPSPSGLLSATERPGLPSDSRSLNTLYFAPKVRWTQDDGLFAEVGVRTIAYFQIDENPDIARYRGHLELTLRAGYDRGFQFSAQLRRAPNGHGSTDLNFTWPANQTPLLKSILPPTLGGYAQIQYFNGYGESLIDYDVRRKDQLRFGLMIAR
jgi:outer membrane phospholipase A